MGQTIATKNKRIKLVGINGRFTHSCLALFYLRNELERHCSGFETELLQFTVNDNYYEMLLRLTSGSPRYIFFSAAVWNSDLVERLTRDLQCCLPSCEIVIGGPQATPLREALRHIPCTIVTCEIEAVEPRFYIHLQENRLARQYGGSFFALNEKWFDFPYRERDFSSHLANRYIYYESSKGCPFSCTYCLSSTEKGVFHKGTEVVKEELGKILIHKPKVVRFIDRTFNDNPQRALEIWKYLRERGGETLFHFEMAPDRFTEEMFTFLDGLPPGKFQFEIGIQSTHPASLAAVQRKCDLEKVRKNIYRLVAIGSIHLHVDLILGLPFDSRTSFAASFCEVFALGAHYIQMGLLKILPDTEIARNAEQYGYLFCEDPPYSILVTRWMDHSELSELYWFSECVEKFYNNRYFVSLWAYLRKQQQDIFAFFYRLLLKCRSEKFFQFAATQELMTRILSEEIVGRQDFELLLELLRYDWLRCNNRFLPEYLLPESELDMPNNVRSRMYKVLPGVLEGVYTSGSRNHFFRKSFFLGFSQVALEEIGVERKGVSIVCFLAQKEQGIYNFNKVLLLGDEDFVP